jgi:hypothetical protein
VKEKELPQAGSPLSGVLQQGTTKEDWEAVTAKCA